MAYDRERHQRRSIRLKDYDYAQVGAYFVTIVCQGRACLFGEIVDGVMILNDAGRMVQRVWDEIPVHYPGVDVDAFVVMPNHMHGVVVLFDVDDVRAGPRARPGIDPGPDLGQTQGSAPTRRLSLGDVVQRFKTLTTKLYTDGVKELGWQRYDRRVWQRNYYEHIIRSEETLNKIRHYIDANPVGWDADEENPAVFARRVK